MLFLSIFVPIMFATWWLMIFIRFFRQIKNNDKLIEDDVTSVSNRGYVLYLKYKVNQLELANKACNKRLQEVLNKYNSSQQELHICKQILQSVFKRKL